MSQYKNSTLKKKVKEELILGRILANPLPGEDVVISGLSGSFPKSRNVYEFRDNLFNKIDMVTPNRRWPNTHLEVPLRSGTIPNDLEQFDTGFFGVHERQSHTLDVMARLLLEKTAEAVFDAGLHPSDLKNTRTGVFVGACFSECEIYWVSGHSKPQSYTMTGVLRSMLAHRISYFLKLKGPSYALDTACSSSAYAIESAYKALRLGEIDYAIVGGINICLTPFPAEQFVKLGILSVDGSCRVFDKSGTGYGRSEGAGVIFLQRSKTAKRIYAHVVHVKANCDGFKQQGITYPSGASMRDLLKDFYEECNIDKYSLSFLEPHGTGTPVGDPEECRAIDSFFTKRRKTPLLMGSIKSNIGHTEPVSGICSVAKCIIAMETGIIPPNINYDTPRDELKGIIEGRLKVVTENTAFEDDRGLLGINSFGFGGGNCHILLRWNKKEKVNHGIPNDDIPRLVCISSRTKEGITCLYDELGKNTADVEYIYLINNVFRRNIQSHLYRGYIIVSKAGEITRSFKYSLTSERMTLHVTFGELNNWYEIGRNLMQLPAFADSIQRFQNNIPDKQLNILEVLSNKSQLRDHYHIIGSIAVQVGIADVLKHVDMKWETIGYSFGELPAAYCHGVLNLEQLINCGLILNRVIHEIANEDKLNGDIYELNNNMQDNANGMNKHNTNDVPEFISRWKKLRLILNSNSTRKMDRLIQYLREPIRNSIEENDKYQSAEKFVKTLVNSDENEHPTLNCVVFNISKYQLNTYITNFPSNKVDSENGNYLEQFLKTIGRLYEYGLNPKVNKLYPSVDLPVSRGTKMISPFIKWKYRNVFVPQFKTEDVNKTYRGIKKVFMAPVDSAGIDFFPVMGYIYLVWEIVSGLQKVSLDSCNISFENCTLIRPVTVPKDGYLKFFISIFDENGNFEIGESGTPIARGRVRILKNNEDTTVEPYVPTYSQASKALSLTSTDVYNELGLRGYHYTGKFRAIEQCDSSITKGYIKWENDWIAFVENLIQIKILQQDNRSFVVPTYIERLIIDIRRHRQILEKPETNDCGNTVIPVLNNHQTGTISSGGVQIFGLLFDSINRKRNKVNSVLQIYKFIPNLTSLELEESVEVNIQIIIENTLVSKLKAIEVIDEFNDRNLPPITPIIRTCMERQLVTQSSLKILTKTPLHVGIEAENGTLASESNSLLVVASKVLERPEILGEAFACLRDDGYILTRESFEISYNFCPDITIITVHKTASETLILFQKQTTPKETKFIRIPSSDNFSWIHETQEAINKVWHGDIVLYSDKEENTSGIIGLVNCLRKEPGKENIKCIYLEDEIFDLAKSKEQLKNNMAFNIYKMGQWGTYRLLLLHEANSIGSDHSFVNVDVKGDLPSLRWAEGPLKSNMILPSGSSMVHVYYTALNLRDITSLSGNYNINVTKTRTQSDCVLGIEYSGRDSSGNRVMGIVSHGALSNLVIADPYLCLKIPDSWSMDEAATVPVAYGTVLYALILRGRIKRNESILIHSGSGEIGQAAIRLALHYDCEVYTTASTQENRDFLRITFSEIAANHIGKSEDGSFEKMIFKNTKGRGVDVVLNSLVEDNIIESVNCLAKGGRLIQVGKFDIEKNKQLNLLLLQKEVSFHGVMFDQIHQQSPENKMELTKLLMDGLTRGAIKPITKNIFSYTEIEQAFRFMTSDQCMGKVLVQIRESEKEMIAIPSVKMIPCMPRYLCDPGKTYVIIGGLGGIGLEFVDWLVARGARKLVLTNRHGISNGYQELRISTWRSYGTIVHIATPDITTEAGCKQLIKESLEIGPIQAIFNLAVVIQDAIFENQTIESFVAAFNPKAVATQHLDDLTRKFCPNLKDFVVFSSGTCGRGNAGQTNYGMANSVMERICEKRRKDGYSGLVIEWGAVGDVGMVAEMQKYNTFLQIGGTSPQPIWSCLDVLDILLKQNEAVIGSSMVVGEKREFSSGQGVSEAVLNILGVADEKLVSVHSTLPEIGMDSVTMVEIRQILKKEHKLCLTAKEIRSMTLARLKELEKNKLNTNQSSREKYVDTLGLEMVFKLTGDESGICMPYIRLQSKVDKESAVPKVFLFPSIEGHAQVFKSLTAHLNAETICMQYMCDSKNTTVKDIAESLVQHIKGHLTKDQPFIFVAYAYGALIGLEILSILEHHGYVGSIICIDGSPLLIKEMLKSLFAASTELLETAIICQLISFGVSSVVISKKRENLLTCDSWEERLNVGSGLLKEHTNIPSSYCKQIGNAIYGRIKDLKVYNASYSELKSRIKLYKSNHVTTLNTPDDYGLSHVFKNSVDIQVFEGSHVNILENELLIKAIDSCVNGDSNR